eukprot:scaffold101392_cov12-Tisochrysis_lutea.AAC.1
MLSMLEEALHSPATLLPSSHSDVERTGAALRLPAIPLLCPDSDVKHAGLWQSASCKPQGSLQSWHVTGWQKRKASTDWRELWPQGQLG